MPASSAALYVREFEAEYFAHTLMKIGGIAVPVGTAESAKRRLFMHIRHAMKADIEGLDPSIVNWADPRKYRFLKDIRPDLFRPDSKRYFAAAKRRVNAILAGPAAAASS